MTRLNEKAVCAAGIADNDEIRETFLRVAKDLGDVLLSDDYEHPFVSLLKKRHLLTALTGDNKLIDQWKRKTNNLLSIVLTPEEPEEEWVITDRLGYFFNTVQPEKRLAGLGCPDEDIRRCIEAAQKERRCRCPEVFSVIVINYNAFVKWKGSADHYGTMYITLWHELGHLFFNPTLHHYISNPGDDYKAQILHPDLEKPAGNFKRSKPFQFLIEGTAEWFARHAEDWDTREDIKRVFPNVFASSFDKNNEYSYFFILERMPSLLLLNILASFFFNCLQTSLWYMPVDDGTHTGLANSDFAGLRYKGRNLMIWSSYPGYILNALQGRLLGYNDFQYISNITHDLIDTRYLRPGVPEALGIQRAKNGASYKDMNPSTDAVPLWGTTYQNCVFDDYYLTGGFKTQESLLLGIKSDGISSSVLGITNDTSLSEDSSSWWISKGLDGNTSKTVLFSKDKSWGTEPARRSAFYTWLEWPNY